MNLSRTRMLKFTGIFGRGRASRPARPVPHPIPLFFAADLRMIPSTFISIDCRDRSPRVFVARIDIVGRGQGGPAGGYPAEGSGAGPYDRSVSMSTHVGGWCWPVTTAQAFCSLSSSMASSVRRISCRAPNRR
jgi:hypothetical protein